MKAIVEPLYTVSLSFRSDLKNRAMGSTRERKYLSRHRGGEKRAS